ncbi:hypothetical protein [Lysobacter sp. P5_B9]
MTGSTSRLSHLRAIGLALLALGLIIKPSMTQLNELHREQHTLSAGKLHGHSGHDHVADHADGSGRSHVGSHRHDDQSGTKHTDGTHGLLHQAGFDGALDGIASEISLTSMLDPSMALPTAAALPPIRRHFGPPLRPPIA